MPAGAPPCAWPLTAALAGLAIGHAAAWAEPATRPDPTVRAVLPGCRSLVATHGIPASAEAAFCNGVIDGLLYLGELLPPDFCYAVPLDMPRVRVVQTIVDEIEPLYPSVKEQHFRALALDVLQYRWPCHYGRAEPSPVDTTETAEMINAAFELA